MYVLTLTNIFSVDLHDWVWPPKTYLTELALRSVILPGGLGSGGSYYVIGKYEKDEE